MKIFVYSGTHWDREWYQCFQGFRYRLVEMTNLMLNSFTDEKAPNYGVFHFDGQTIVLEDYLAIEPGKRARLTELIQAGKIVIGPWYCMPDEFIISGESLIKNLQIGAQICREQFGVEPSSTGYVCDIFGHIAQMPQIFDGMNLHHTVLGRGTNEHTTAMHFRWQAPDGTEVVAFKLPDEWGYCDFTVRAMGDAVPVTAENEAEITQRIKAYIDSQIVRANVPVLFLLDAADHIHFHAHTAQYLNIIQKLYPDAEVYHANIAEMNKAVDVYFHELPVKAGELNETAKNNSPYDHLITNTLSSRYPIKKYNDRMQTRLEKWISPLHATGLIHEPLGFMHLANRYLIQNHPHDSICGCSIDQVHQDMMYRFDQVQLITEEILARFRNQLRGDMGAYGKEDTACGESRKIVRIFNPLPYRVAQMMEAQVDFEKGWAKYAEPFGYENVCRFKIYDFDGKELPYGISDIITYPDRDVYKISFKADLIACGVTEFEVRPTELPSRYLERMPQTARSVDTGAVRLTVNIDGTIDILDHETGVVYQNLLTLIDDGEIGDGWYHANPAIDRTVTNTHAEIEKIEDNINRVVFRVTVKMMLPEAMDRAHFGCRRSDSYREFTVVHTITAAKGEKKIDVRTAIDNNILDHRLRLRLPTEIAGTRYAANQAFCFVERDTDVKAGTDDWMEYGVIEKQMDGIVVKRASDGSGFAFVSAYGLHECGVSSDGNMDITLFRSYLKTVNTHGEPGGQLLEHLEFHYALVPLEKHDTLPSLQRLQQVLQAGTEMVTMNVPALRKYDSVLAIDSDSFIYSTSNPVDGKGEIRVYNASGDTETGTVTLPKNTTKAWLTTIDGRVIEELNVQNRTISLTLGKWKIATVRFA